MTRPAERDDWRPSAERSTRPLPPPSAVAAPREPYWRHILDATPRLLGQLDRERLSPTWGSFDRDHWAWKFRDFPINMLQTGLLPLAWLFGRQAEDNPYAGNEQLREWIAGGLECLLARQHGNGAFDTVGPYTQDHGVTLAMAYTVGSLLPAMDGALPSPLRDRALESVARACRFAVQSEEDYAFISNHQALFALAWQRAGRLLGDVALVARGEATVGAILGHQSADGWYREYGGPDPGYESLGILYLALYRQAQPDPALDASLTRALAFHAHCVHPDGSVGGGYGSRHTSLWYPGGFELLAGDFPMARSTARFLRERLALGNIVTPATVDPHNLPSLLSGYLVAADASLPAVEEACPALPCQGEAPLRLFNDSGLAVAATPHYFAVTNLSKGGVLAVFDRERARLLHEDAGYVLQASGADWTSALLGAGHRFVRTGDDGVEVSATFGRARREVLTPLKFLLLRILNLTVFRSRRLGALVRRMIIARLVTGRIEGPFRLRRRIVFTPEQVVVDDEIVADVREGVTSVVRPRSFTAVHMGSARYFHPRELVSFADEGRAEASWANRLRTSGHLSLHFTVTAPAPPARTAHPEKPDDPVPDSVAPHRPS